MDGYLSPLTARIDDIRTRIMANAEERSWTIDEDQLDDRHIVRRMVLKRCVYGVDKNPMAVELAKVALWLHTFTVGAPLSFLDHHLRCGDSLFGSWVRTGIDRAESQGGSLWLRGPITKATSAAASMQVIEGLTDAEIAEAHRSADIFAGVEESTTPLNAFLSLVQAFGWLNRRDRDDTEVLGAYFAGVFGDPIDIALGAVAIEKDAKGSAHFAALLDQAQRLIAEEHFLHWQVAFPGVWTAWDRVGLHGGFDAVIGNPPWDRIKLQQVEWFAARRRAIAMAARAADRKRMIDALETAGDPLASEFADASARAQAAAHMARASGEYPLLSGGDINLYSLFVERAMTLVKPDGMVGLLTPSGIASDKTASTFFKGVATEGRLRALYDFENKKVFFPDVHASFKFCVLVASPSPGDDPARCAFYCHRVAELDDPERCFPLTAEDFARVNPNTGTAPIFRTRRDAALTTAIYNRFPVLVDRSSGAAVKAWPVKYATMFHMTNDSGLFRTRAELEEREGAWPVGGNRFGSSSEDWVPLYEGKMVQAFDHRAANIVVNLENQYRPAQPVPATPEQHQDLNWLPDPQFWVKESETSFPGAPYLLTFKDVTATTNVRSMIAALIPGFGVGNTLPIVSTDGLIATDAVVLLANFNALPFDYVARQKIQGQHLNWFIVEQLPVVPPDRYETMRFGPKTAGEIVREMVLELTYTAHDMAPFARDLGYLDEAGEVKPPFRWDEDRRLRLRAKLDAVFFHLYGVTDRDEVRYIYCLCLADELLARRSLEGLGNGWAGAPEQRGKEFGEVDEPLSCGADDAGEDLLGLRAAGRPITAADFAVDDGGANGVLGTPVGGLHLGRPQEGEHGGELAVEMGGEALGGRQGGRRVEESPEAREQAPAGHGEAVLGDRVRLPSITEREGVGEDRLHASRPRTARMIRGEGMRSAHQVRQTRLMQRRGEAAIRRPPVSHQDAVKVGAQHLGRLVEATPVANAIHRGLRRRKRPQPVPHRADPPAGLVGAHDGTAADLCAQRGVGRGGHAGRAMQHLHEPPGRHRQPEALPQECGHLGEGHADLLVQARNQGDGARPQVDVGGPHRVRGLQRMAALHAAPALGALPDGHIKAPDNRPDDGEIFLVLRRHALQCHRPAAPRTRRRERGLVGRINPGGNRATRPASIPTAGPPPRPPAPALGPIFGERCGLTEPRAPRGTE